jgi:hypothetical protein
VRVIELDKVGLSAARNAGVKAAEGDVVAFIDNDTEAEPHWLDRIWRLLDRLGADATGGPNLPFPDAGFEERVVSGAPGANTPVVNADGSAILLAGCNMAFRRDAVLRAGGFDETFPGAYDDVVFCVRLADAGGKLVYHPTASIWHHRRDSIPGFLRQQYKWGQGTQRFEDAHQGRDRKAGEPAPGRTLGELARLDRGRLRYVFSGPQADQLYLLTSQPLHLGLPLKLLVALAAVWLAGAPVAWRLGRLGGWVAVGALAKLALLAVVTARVPVVSPEPGARGLAQRLATAVLWFAQPLAWRLGDLAARRR